MSYSSWRTARLVAAIGSVVALGSSGAQSQDAAGAVALEGIEVTANPIATVGDPNAGRTFAGGRGQVSAAQLEASGVSNITEALRLIPGVQTPPQNGTGGGDYAQNVGIRGLNSRLGGYATVLLDGVPLSNAPYGQPELSLAPVSFGMLQEIDVIKSGASVRYGPQNVGGVINYVTLPIPRDPGGQIRLRGNMNAAGGVGGAFQGQADVMVGGSNAEGSGVALLYSANHGPTFRPNTNQDIDDGMLKYRIQLTPESYIDGRVHGFNASAKLPGPLNQAAYNLNPFASTNAYQSYQASRLEGVARYVNEFDGTKYFETTVFDTNSRRTFGLSNANRDATATVFDVLPRTYNTFGIEPRFSMRVAPLDIPQEVSVGYRYIREDSTEQRLRRSFTRGAYPFSTAPLLNRDSTGTTDAHAFYVDDKFTFGALTITPGIRVEDVTIGRRNTLSGYQSEQGYVEPLPSVRVGYQANDNLFLYANAGRSFGSLGYLQLPLAQVTQSLSPELANTYEIGARYNQSGFSAEAAVFRLDFDNQIESGLVAGTYVNVGRTLHQGVEGSLRYDFAALTPALEGFNAYATYAYTRATIEEGQYKGNDLRLYSRHTGTVGAGYATGAWHFDWFGYAQSRQFADEANTQLGTPDGRFGKIPGWLTWNGKVGYDVTPDARIYVGVENVFDTRFYTRASIEDNSGLYVGPPRTAFVELRMRF
jgi:Fe(3+) dicitrate transport protein